jgi:beta-glucanase (GH16 family)
MYIKKKTYLCAASLAVIASLTACGGSSSDTIITPTPNLAPEPAADNYSLAEGDSVSGNVATNDPTTGLGALVYSTVTEPVNGTLEFNADGSFSYVPASGFSGEDGFTYSATEDDSDTANAVVSFTVAVNPAPAPQNDSFTVDSGGSLSGDISSNDDTAGLGALSYALGTAPTHGTFDLSPNGSFSYTPEGGYVGEDSFSYTVTENDGDTGSAMVSITVLGSTAYQLVWADEFNGGSIDMGNWTHQIFPGVDSGNNELQYYTDRSENSRIEEDPDNPGSGNHMLVIEAHKESPKYLGHDYSSARLMSADKADFLYGRFEARIKIPSGKGFWPAFWLLPTDWIYGGWAASGEIDVMESVNVANEVYGTLHHGGEWPDNVHTGCSYDNQDIQDFGDDFHVYSVEWEPSEFRWYIDGELYCTQTTWSSPNGSFPAPFDQRFHILLNVAVGGDWPGSPNTGTVFPQKMWVDYVRVSQNTNEQPTVSLSNPLNNAALPTGTNTLTAIASDTDGSIEQVKFYANGNFLGFVTEAPYLFEWSTADGCYNVRVDAIDNLGGLATEIITGVTVGVGCPAGPFNGVTAAIPGTIQAENFDQGPAGEAYSDTTSGNLGKAYRTDSDVDMEASSAGGYNVGWIDDGEYLNYTVDVATAGSYNIDISVASPDGGGVFHIEFDGVDVTGPITVPKTDGWQSWTTVSAVASIEAGEQEMRFVAETASSAVFNLDFFNITAN